MGKAGEVIVVIGRQRSGKSPFIEWLRTQLGFENNVVFDRRGEYSDKNWSRFFSFESFKEFLFSDDCEGCLINIEEATAFISGMKSLNMSDVLTGIAHNHNTMIVVFHSLADAPQYILRLSSYIVLFPTNDDPRTIKNSRSKLYPAFLSVNNPKRAKSKEGWNVPEIVDYNS